MMRNIKKEREHISRMPPRRDPRTRDFHFPDFPDFRPNLAPKEIFQLGSFGGTYWRPIRSAVTGRRHSGRHLRYPKSWWRGVKHLTLPFEQYDKSANRYGVRVGETLEQWEDKGWIAKKHPYGWVEWYCDFFCGKRHGSEEDGRQIKRWQRLAGPNGRFRNRLIGLLQSPSPPGKLSDESVSPAIRQTLQHWAYRLTPLDLRRVRRSRRRKGSGKRI